MSAERRVKVPWFNSSRWNEDEDLKPQGDPETAVFLTNCTLVGLHIHGIPDHVMLGIREDPTGQPVSCAITNELLVDTFTRVQSNPRRSTEHDDA